MKKKLLTFLFFLGFALLLMEMGLRVHAVWSFTGSLFDAYKKPENPSPGSQVTLGQIIRPSPNNRIIYELKPDLDVFLKGARVRTNGLGWREGPMKIPKASGTKRIVGVGDSVMFGWGVSENQRYMDLLEDMLNLKMPENKWETIVFAAPGYNLAMLLAVLEDYALAYEPDLIIYGFVVNDRCLPNFVLPKRESGMEPKWYTAEYLRNALANIRAQTHENNEIAFLGSYENNTVNEICTPEKAPDEYKDMVGMINLLKGVERLNELAGRVHIPIVVHFPIRTASLRNNRRLLAKLQSTFGNLIFSEYTDRLDDYLKKNGYDDYRQTPLALSEDDPHPSPQGHELTAQWLHDFLMINGVFDPSKAKK